MEEEKPYPIWLPEYFFKLVHIIIGYYDKLEKMKWQIVLKQSNRDKKKSRYFQEILKSRECWDDMVRWGLPCGSAVKNPPSMQEPQKTQV